MVIPILSTTVLSDILSRLLPYLVIIICYYVIKYVRKTKKSHQTLFRVREGLGPRLNIQST